MNTVRVTVHLVDGGLMELSKGQQFMREPASLQAQGFTGKQLIHRLISDDWATPPLAVAITGTMPDGRPINITIPYT